jgi:hypothetical protein
MRTLIETETSAKAGGYVDEDEILRAESGVA